MLDISGRLEEDFLYLVWAETGGPAIVEEPELLGFGTKMIARSVASQLGGELSHDWQSAGLVATLRIRAARMAF
jgi:two-component sensor histidine kinase